MIINKLLVLSICAVAGANKVDDALRVFVNNARNTKSSVDRYYRKDGGARNQHAADAANDFYNRAREKQSAANQFGYNRLLTLIWADYEHHKKWENQFRKWARWDPWHNNYAKDTHKNAKNDFLDLYNKVDNLVSNMDKNQRPKVKTILLYANACEVGCGSGFMVEKYKKGSKQSSSITNKLSTKLTTQVNLLIASISAEIGHEWAETLSQDSWEETEHELKINFDRPLFVYQIVGEFMTNAGQSIGINGGLRMFDTRQPDLEEL